jgi:hypothetical protein
MGPRNVQLRDIALDPDQLLGRGYIRVDESTSDPVRRVVYQKAITSDESQLKLLVEIHFELSISDDVGYEYCELCSYSFNCVKLEVLDRQMEPLDNLCFDELTEQSIGVGTLKLGLKSLEEVERLVTLLTPAETWR